MFQDTELPSRRFFLTTLFKTVVAIPLIGAGTSVFLDSTKVFNPLLFTTMMEYEMSRVRPMIVTLFDKDDAFYKAIIDYPAQHTIIRDMRIPLQIRPGGKFGR